MILESKGVLSNTAVLICNKCKNFLHRRILPPCSIASMPLCSVPDCFKILTLPEKLLISLYRMKVIILKLQPYKPGSHYAIKGNTITFTQNISSITNMINEVPARMSSVNDTLKVIFVGRKIPKKNDLKNILNVRRQVVIDALKFLKEHHYMYNDIPLSRKNLRTLPHDDVPHEIYKCITLCHKKDDDNEEMLNGPYVDAPVSLTHTGIVDVDGTQVSEDEKKCAAVNKDEHIIAVPHGCIPVNEYNNAELWLGSYSHLFPFGTGGPTTLDGRKVTLKTYLQHLLNFCHHEYRKEMMFVMSMYNVIHKQEVALQTALTIRRPLFTQMHADRIDSVKSQELKQALLKQKDISQLSPQVQCLLKQLHAVGKRIPGSGYAKKSMRKEIHSQMVRF